VTVSLARIEAACATAVERAFALAFPSALQPVQIARKLVASFEAASGPVARAGRRFVVRLGAADHARLAADLPYLERQWAAMLAGLAERSGRPQRAPEVASALDLAVAAGTVAIAVEMLAEPRRLALRVRKGLSATLALREGRIVVGRDPACDLVVADPRVSRRHLEVTGERGAYRFADLGSSNGTQLNGAPAAAGALAMGDVLGVGDSEVVVDADERDGAR